MGSLLAVLLKPIQVSPDTSGVQPATVWSADPPPAWLRGWHEGLGYSERPRAYGI